MFTASCNLGITSCMELLGLLSVSKIALLDNVETLLVLLRSLLFSTRVNAPDRVPTEVMIPARLT